MIRVPVILAIAPALAGLVWLWQRDRRAALLLGYWTLSALLGVAVQRRWFTYHWHPLAWSLAPLAGLGFAAAIRREEHPGAAGRLIALGTWAVLLFAFAFPLQMRVREWVTLLRGGYPTYDEYLRQFPLTETGLLMDDMALAGYLERHTQPDDRVLVWDSPLPNALSQRRTPGNVGFFHTVVLPDRTGQHRLDSGPLQQRLRTRLLADLQSPDTRLIAVSRTAWLGQETELRKGIPQLFPELGQELASRWRLVDSVRDYRIFRRSVAVPPLNPSPDSLRSGRAP
jgi:hypothetical protein